MEGQTQFNPIVTPQRMNQVVSAPQRPGGASQYIATLPYNSSVPERKRRRERIQQKARESKIGVPTFLAVGRAAIHVSVRSEPNQSVREVKLSRLDKMWSDFEGKLLGIIRS